MASTRDQIIEKTCQLLELQGYYATGLNQIIRESGSPKGSLYYHFPGGKEELAAEAVEHVGRMVLKSIEYQLDSIDDAADAVHTMIADIATTIEQSDYTAGGPITTIAIETASGSEALREVCYRIYEQWRDVFYRKMLTGGIDETRADRIASLTMACIEGGVILCRTSRNRGALDAVADEIALTIRQAMTG